MSPQPVPQSKTWQWYYLWQDPVLNLTNTPNFTGKEKHQIIKLIYSIIRTLLTEQLLFHASL